MKFNPCWTEDQDAKLRRLHATSLSFSEIAAQLNAEFGTEYSRNAAIGRARRLELPLRGPSEAERKAALQAKRERDAARKRKIRARQMPSALVINPGGYEERSVDVATLDIGMMELTDTTCRYATTRINDKWQFCGRCVKPNSKWCPEHHAICCEPIKLNHAGAAKPHYRERMAA